MDDILKAILNNGGGVYALILYIVIRDVIPKLFPEISKVLTKRITTEDRLFNLLETNSEVLLKLNFSLSKLNDNLEALDHRISTIESVLVDSSSALNVAKRLIK